MKDQLSLIISVALLVFVAFRLYQKYVKKDDKNAHTGSLPKKSSGFPAKSGDDDYEPYSKK